ncbi:MAG: hypothetical protein MZV63_16935 [Marinilabiliales bacterium]|nr:hypothetical protein [Marinilabiliales bacterium]
MSLLLCCKTRAWPFIFQLFLSLQGKSEEEVSSAGEQLTSNKIYDGENTTEELLLEERLFFVVFNVTYGLKNSSFQFYYSFQ